MSQPLLLYIKTIHVFIDILWCCALSHRLFCTTKTRPGVFTQFLILFNKMHHLIKERDPLDRLSKFSKLTEIYIFSVTNFATLHNKLPNRVTTYQIGPPKSPGLFCVI